MFRAHLLDFEQHFTGNQPRPIAGKHPPEYFDLIRTDSSFAALDVLPAHVGGGAILGELFQAREFQKLKPSLGNPFAHRKP